MFLKIAAAAAFALAAGGLPYLAIAPRAGASPFAEAAQKLRDAHTLSYSVSMQFPIPGQDKPTKGREFYKDPGLVRTEWNAPNESVVVLDTARGKILSLDPTSKVALLQDWKIPDDPGSSLAGSGGGHGDSPAIAGREDREARRHAQDR